MAAYLRLLIAVLALLTTCPARAEPPRGWLGADVQDVTKAEADRLGWDTPHGAKVGLVAPGSPADKAGLKTGDIIDLSDGVEVETSAAFEKTIAGKGPGTEVRLRVLSGGRERRVVVALVERPTAQASGMTYLTLDTGGHMARVKSIAFTPDGKQLVSAGDDKVIRVWDWQAGRTVRTLRGEVRPGNEGQIYAIALSPDGGWLAAGGWMSGSGQPGHSIRLYEFASGKLVTLLKGHQGYVTSLAFSPDSRHLISGSADKTAIIWSVENGQPPRWLTGHNDAVIGAAFSPDGERALTIGADQTLRLWQVSRGTQIAVRDHKDAVRALAVSPADGTIATGTSDGAILLWNGTTGDFLRTLANQEGHVGSLSFSPDGKLLVSSCASYCRGGYAQQVWDVATGLHRAMYAGHDDTTVSASAVSPDGGLVATGDSPGQVHIWNLTNGQAVGALRGSGARLPFAGLSRDGSRLIWGNTFKSASKANDWSVPRFQLRLPTRQHPMLGQPETLPASEAKDVVGPRVTYSSWSLTHAPGGSYVNGTLEIRKDGKVEQRITLDRTNGFAHNSYSFTPDGQAVVSGGANGSLIVYDLKGQRLGNFVGHEGDMWAATPSPDGRYLVSGSTDQTIRLWNLKTRELVVTFFPGTDGEWVIWTPQGYYTGSPGADKIVGWQINRGPDQAADYVTAEQLRRHLNRPDIVQKAIMSVSAEQAVREALGTTFQLVDLLALPVPRFKIVAPLAASAERGGRSAVQIAIEPTLDPIKAIRVQVNGRQVEEQTPDVGSGGFGPGLRALDVPLAQGRNDVRITLINSVGEKAETLTILHEGEGALDKRGTLYILAVGVDRYPGLGKTCGALRDASCDLSFSGADARALVEVVETRLGPTHAKVVKRMLVNGAAAGDDPTASNILDAIDLLKQARETDTVLLFIAGHGVNEGSHYRFLATNAERAGEAFRGATVISWQILQEAVETAKGRRILLIDTCHAGSAYNQRLGNAAYHANIIAYTAARFDQEALEDKRLGHGLFTYAVVEGLGGKGRFEAKRRVSTKELAEYVARRVDELAKSLKGAQEPQYFKGPDAEDYVLVRW